MARPLPLHGAAPAPASPLGWAVAGKGFRPFFLLAGAFAVAIVPLWLMIIAGTARPTAYLDATTWHAHEMIFGYTAAVLAGFLLTAVGNWTQRETLVGAPLVALAAAWTAGRAAMLAAGALPRGVPAALDLAFWPLLLLALARPLIAARNRRNFVMLGVVAALFAANLTVHLAGVGALAPEAARRACAVGVDVLVVVLLVIAGRVFPMFTRNATGVTAIRSFPALDALTIAFAAALAALDAVGAPARVAGALAGLTALLAAARAARWGAVHALRTPLLWILHAGYAWLVVGLALRAVAAFDGAIAPSFPLHALTVGALGCTTLGMMARVALGHTGRPLAPHAAMTWAFAAMNAAAAARVVVPLVAPALYFHALLAAGALWTFAFAVFLVTYAPILVRPRIDGKPG